MDEEPVDQDLSTVGERLRAAREERGLSLEDVAAQTRIPQRHLESIEGSHWDRLPAPTYTIGFARSYASVIGLDRGQVADQLRQEMGGQRLASTTHEILEPADPARTMPKGLVIGAVIAVILFIILMSWLNRRSLEQPDGRSNAPASMTSAPATSAAQQRTTPAATSTAQGPVVLTASAPAWIHISDRGKTLFQGELAPGQSYTVPSSALAPMLKAGKPEALKVTVGSAIAPPVGPAGRVVSNVSLRAGDLMRSRGTARTPANGVR